MLDMESAFEGELRCISPERHDSARNLLHYVALRRHDIRMLQEELMQRGLSSLGRCESHVLANVDAVLDILARVRGANSEIPPPHSDRLGIHGGQSLIDKAARELLGASPDLPGPSIMVTMPREAAGDYQLVHDLVASGMDVMRINCAHDDQAVWKGMIANLRRAERALGRTCRVAMDLAGPKIRTGEIEPGPAVIRWQPARDKLGRVAAPARVWLFPADKPRVPARHAAIAVPVEGNVFEVAEIGDELRFRDAAGRTRSLRIAERAAGGVWAESRQTTYVVPQIPLQLVRATGTWSRSRQPVYGRVGPISPLQSHLLLHKGDRLILTAPSVLGRPAIYDAHGQLRSPAQIGCTISRLFPDLRSGERILLDDGRITGTVRDVQPTAVTVEITRTRSTGEKLRAGKGINLPDSSLTLPALTDKDMVDLAFIVQHADLASYSFVRHVDDVRRLQAELARLGRPDFSIILKIENRQAFENLPLLLLAVMRNPAAVMIARGDLAVECGYERLAEVQEEILWLCEAAHMPVIWATQVLETLAKRGIPSRAEVTDAASSGRAECVMLNKGPYIVDAVRALDDILRRMQVHQVKKRPMLRKLRLAENIVPLPRTSRSGPKAAD
jgi:pyruvate kinase